MTERPSRSEQEDPSPVNPDDRPGTPPTTPKVTPLDEDEKIKDGIEVNET